MPVLLKNRGRAGSGRASPRTSSASVTSSSGEVAPASIARITSPASRRADARDSTTTVARAARASLVSRRSGSWEPIATTTAWSATSEPSKSGSRAVVQRPTMSTSSIGRTARIASTWVCACGPRPNTRSRRASGIARCRTARAETAAVRTLVRAIPSTIAMGASVSPSKTTQTPWIRGSPPMVTSFTTGWWAAAEGMTSSWPRSSSTALRGGSASGSRPSSSAASSASAAAGASSRRRTSSASRNGRLIARRRGSSQHEASPQRVAGIEDEAVLAGPERRALHLGEQPLRRLPDRAGLEARADDRLVPPRLPRVECAVGGQERRPRGSGRAGGGAVDLAVREDRHVAVVERAELLVDDRPVDAGEAVVGGVAGDVGALEGPLHAAAGGDQLGQVLGHDPKPEALCGHEGVDGAAEGHVHLDGVRLNTARHHERRHVAEGHALDRACSAPDPRDHAAGGDVDGHVDVAVGGGGHTGGLDRPPPPRGRGGSPRGGVAVLVPEKDAEVRALVVRGHEKAAVHVGVAARLVAEEAPDPVDLFGAHGVLAPGRDGLARDLEHIPLDDPKRLAGGVVVGRRDLHGGSLSQALRRRCAGARPTAAGRTSAATARRPAAGKPPLRLRTPLSPRGVPRGSPPVSRAARTPWPAPLPRSR